MAAYVNNVDLHMNELAILQFNLNDQGAIVPLAKVAMTYEFLAQVHNALGHALEQHNAKLNFIKAEGVGKGN